MFRATSRTCRASFKRFFAAGAQHDAPAATQTEIDVTKVFSMAVLAGVSLYFYRSSDSPVVETAYYKQMENRDQMRSDAYLKRYKTSFIKTFIRDKGGLGQNHLRAAAHTPIPQTFIHLHSPYGQQFGAGIKTDKLGPRRERIKYFAPLQN
ncbi:hypothetical protein METBIDRAFT_41078 [Metschnikowia bicuspidata var. bicuspidata NRRL YB-4993]|uniref:Uncharacterized protein n=1 Tax=Metschnikowia bicuspidata var. bicuspidata NRRL YB-4993 TaxID=869754 RepID=A0A1A0HC49_9ASCO|nr:hypothetical protein METBIDRAFT_41078 [Metschnikowia bicuspidata var. bicuspidata NRRL YB-4993]OBA21586.1 hypothetical protein METBIDRAFT_41078 [Metschnikowia bicuspidata var. bicuspidata NRRL YB-4993]